MFPIAKCSTTLIVLFAIWRFSSLFEYCNATSGNDIPIYDTSDSSNFSNRRVDYFRRNIPIACNRTSLDQLYIHSKFRDIFDGYWPYTRIVAYIKYIHKTYPNITKLKEIGVTHENRTLYVLTIGFGLTNNNVIFISAGLHAREWSSIMMALYIIFGLVECQIYPTSPIHYLDWMILPVANPDGYQYSLGKDEQRRTWRKNRSPCPDNDKCKGNQGCGVDLNKNFPFMFSGIGGSVHPCSNIYTGDKPCSELETKAIVKNLESIKNQLKLYVDIHGYGGVIMYPYSNNKAPYENQDELIRLAKLYVEATNNGVLKEKGKYKLGNYADLQNPSSGTVLDFVRGSLQIPYVYVIRLIQDMGRADGFYVDAQKALAVATQSFLGIKAMAEDVYNNNPPAKSFLRQKLGYRRRRRNHAKNNRLSCFLFFVYFSVLFVYLIHIYNLS